MSLLELWLHHPLWSADRELGPADEQGEVQVPDGAELYARPSEEPADAGEITRVIDEVRQRRLPGLWLEGCDALDDQAARGLAAALPGLRLLNLGETEVTDDGLEPLGGLSALRVLDLGEGGVTDEGLAHLLRLTELVEVGLGSTGITDQGLTQLSGLPALVRLDLGGTQITHAGFGELVARCPKLQALDLRATDIGDAGARHLGQLPGLELLDLRGTRLTDAAVAPLAGLARLRVLHLSGTRITDAALDAVGRLGDLELLDLGGTQVGEGGLEALGQLQRLETLYLWSTRTGDAGLASLASLSSLRTLWLWETRISDAAVGLLAGLPELAHLNLRGTPIGDGAVPELLRLASLQTLNLRATRVSAAGLARLRSARPDLEIVEAEDPSGDRDMSITIDELNETHCKTYLLSVGSEAALIDPVRERLESYRRVLSERGLTLRMVLETHLHADHLMVDHVAKAALGAEVIMHQESPSPLVDRHVVDGTVLRLGGEPIEVLHTPGHTPDSCCFAIAGAVFTGDTLLIGGSGRTDFPGGDAGQQFDAVTGRLFRMPDSTRVYPAHDYKGQTSSTIGAERAGNPRFAGQTRESYIALMGNLGLPFPEKVQQALQVNQSGFAPAEVAFPLVTDVAQVQGLSAAQLHEQLAGASDPGHGPVLIDVREPEEFVGELGHIQGALLVPMDALERRLPKLAGLQGHELVVVCRAGARSASACAMLERAGFRQVRNLTGGMLAWVQAGHPVQR